MASASPWRCLGRHSRLSGPGFSRSEKSAAPALPKSFLERGPARSRLRGKSPIAGQAGPGNAGRRNRETCLPRPEERGAPELRDWERAQRIQRHCGHVPIVFDRDAKHPLRARAKGEPASNRRISGTAVLLPVSRRFCCHRSPISMKSPSPLAVSICRYAGVSTLRKEKSIIGRKGEGANLFAPAYRQMLTQYACNQAHGSLRRKGYNSA